MGAEMALGACLDFGRQTVAWSYSVQQQWYPTLPPEVLWTKGPQ